MLINIIIVEINLKSRFLAVFFKKIYPAPDVKKSAGNVAIPNKNMPKAASAGLAIDAAIAKAPYNSPHGINPRKTPRKKPFIPSGFLNR